MTGRDAEARPLIFRPRRILALVMAFAGALWLAVLVYLLRFDEVPLETFLSALFFVAFFGVSLAYYARTLILVDSGGITYRGMLRTLRLSFHDIRKVDVLQGPVTVYAVRGNGRFVHFTSFFEQHRALASLLIERAGLSPLSL